MNLPESVNLAKCKFGVIQNLDELFEAFLYLQDRPALQGGRTTDLPSAAWCFISHDQKAPIVTFPPGHRHPGPALYTRPKAQVIEHMWTRAMTGGVLFSFRINTFRPGEPWTLITGTDSTMIPTIYLAYIETSKLPVIDPTNTKIWTPGELA